MNATLGIRNGHLGPLHIFTEFMAKKSTGTKFSVAEGAEGALGRNLALCLAGQLPPTILAAPPPGCPSFQGLWLREAHLEVCSPSPLLPEDHGGEVESGSGQDTARAGML
jgi:hypothetical protein